jgi:hypothetical protein
MQQFRWFIVLGFIVLLMIGCSPKNSSLSKKLLRVAVPADTFKDEISDWKALYKQVTNAETEVVTIPQAQYRDRVWSALLSGQAPWDVLLIDGKWVQEFAQYRTVMRIANKEDGSVDLFSEISSEEGRYAIPYHLDIPLLITQQNPNPEIKRAIESYRSGSISFADWVVKSPLTIGFVGVGATDWLMATPSVGAQYTTLTAPKDPEFPFLLQFVCKINSSGKIDPRSFTWSARDLIDAVDRDEIDIGVLWLSQIRSLGDCAEGNANTCIGLTKINVIPLHDVAAPRRMSAWVIAANSTQSGNAIQFLEAISPTPKVIDVPTGISTANRELIECAGMSSSAGISAMIREDIFDKIDGLINRCMEGEIGPSQFTQEYQDLYLMAENNPP